MGRSHEVGESIEVRRPARYGETGPVPMPTERTLRERLRDIRRHLAELEGHAAEFDARIFGNGGEKMKAAEIDSFDDQLTDVGTRLACMVGFLATVNQRFGVKSDEKAGYLEKTGAERL